MASEFIIYQTEDGQTKIQTRLENETVWLTQAQMAELFDKGRSTITEHIGNVFKEGELDKEVVSRKIRHTTQHGAISDKTQEVESTFYNLNVIISVGYRVKSHRGTKFRQWAAARLREYIIKGFTLNDDLLNEAGGGNYFEELLARIRDIRSSEKVFWRKVLDVYATSIDYDPNAKASNVNNVFKEEELGRDAVVANFATTASDGQLYQVEHYNLDMIISVGYRVKSRQGTQFRQWATQRLKDF